MKSILFIIGHISVIELEYLSELKGRARYLTCALCNCVSSQFQASIMTACISFANFFFVVSLQKKMFS